MSLSSSVPQFGEHRLQFGTFRTRVGHINRRGFTNSSRNSSLSNLSELRVVAKLRGGDDRRESCPPVMTALLSVQLTDEGHCWIRRRL